MLSTLGVDGISRKLLAEGFMLMNIFFFFKIRQHLEYSDMNGLWIKATCGNQTLIRFKKLVFGNLKYT